MANDPSFVKSPVIFNIFRVTEEGLELVSTGSWSHRFYGYFSVLHDEKVYTDFTKGDYMIQVSVSWKVEKEEHRILNLSYNSDQHFELH